MRHQQVAEGLDGRLDLGRADALGHNHQASVCGKPAAPNPVAQPGGANPVDDAGGVAGAARTGAPALGGGGTCNAGAPTGGGRVLGLGGRSTPGGGATFIHREVFTGTLAQQKYDDDHEIMTEAFHLMNQGLKRRIEG